MTLPRRNAGEMIANPDGSVRHYDDPEGGGTARCLEPECERFTLIGRFGGKAVCPPDHVMPPDGMLLYAPKYTVECWHEGRWWMARVPALSALTQADDRDQLGDQVEDLICTITDHEPNTFYLDFVWFDAVPPE